MKHSFALSVKVLDDMNLDLEVPEQTLNWTGGYQSSISANFQTLSMEFGEDGKSQCLLSVVFPWQ